MKALLSSDYFVIPEQNSNSVIHDLEILPIWKSL